jgi:hypothetical protein
MALGTVDCAGHDGQPHVHNPVDEDMTAAEKDLETLVDELPRRAGVRVEWELLARTCVIAIHERVMQVLAGSAGDLGLGCVRASSTPQAGKPAGASGCPERSASPRRRCGPELAGHERLAPSS